MERRRSDDALLQSALNDLPIFPLPGTVFFPHTLLPLHVFEPRYRAMTEVVLETHQHLAVVLIQGGNTVPDVARVAGLGRVVHHERLPDGRFHLLLQGIGRTELVEELPPGDRAWRRCRAKLVETMASDDAVCAREVQSLRSCYARLLESAPACKETLGDLPLKIREPCALCDVVCAAVLDDVPARQAALEELDVCRRLIRANEALANLLLASLGTEPARMH